MIGGSDDGGGGLVFAAGGCGQHRAPHPATRLRYTHASNGYTNGSATTNTIVNGNNSASSNGKQQENGAACNGASHGDHNNVHRHRQQQQQQSKQFTNGHVLNGNGCSNGHRVTSDMSDNQQRASKERGDDGKSGESAKREEERRRLKLCKIGDVPSYLRFNPFILDGYRPPQLTWRQSIASLCYFHNETVNILTHGEWANCELLPNALSLNCVSFAHVNLRGCQFVFV